MNVSLRFFSMTRAYRRFRKAITILKREFASSFLSRSSSGTTREALQQECARRVAREPALREAIDEACRHWAKHQKWPMMGQDAAQYVFDRIVSGQGFGADLIKARIEPPAFATVEEALCWLTVDCWHSTCLQEWRALLTAPLP